MRWFVLSLAVILSGCSLFELLPEPPAPPVRPQPPAPPEPSPPAIPPAVPPAPPAPPTPPAPPVTEPTPPVVVTPPDPGKPQPVAMPWLKRGDWSDLPGWRADEVSQAWGAFLQTCRGLRFNPSWIGVCQIAAKLPQQPENWQVRSFFEQRFQPWQISQAEGGQEGLVTGYYEPLLRGSRTQSAKYSFPLRSPPEDLLVVDLSTVYPELKNLRLRGRLQGNKVVPYFTRSEIEAGAAPLPGRELVWVDDPVELFFLQVQGSGRVQFENGEVMRVGYADQNGHPYRSIGKWLVEKGELTLDKASMQGIKDWGRRNPQRLAELLNSNPSYVYFRELPGNGAGPLGALGVPLTSERSIAVDPRGTPLGAPVWLATTMPNSAAPLQRLMLAQDTGGAIRGNVRADFFWGFGDEAGKQAGAMKQRGRMWVLLPKDFPILSNGN
ncbi:MAG: murein transglycosylase A [Betaproteobacteria bacterium]|nr:murein transglycosylase A [Betaproteobacteria bacterium]